MRMFLCILPGYMEYSGSSINDTGCSGSSISHLLLLETDKATEPVLTGISVMSESQIEIIQ